MSIKRWHRCWKSFGLILTCSPKFLAVLEVSGALAIVAVTLASAARYAIHLKIILWALLWEPCAILWNVTLIYSFSTQAFSIFYLAWKERKEITIIVNNNNFEPQPTITLSRVNVNVFISFHTLDNKYKKGIGLLAQPCLSHSFWKCTS